MYFIFCNCLKDNLFNLDPSQSGTTQGKGYLSDSLSRTMSSSRYTDSLLRVVILSVSWPIFSRLEDANYTHKNVSLTIQILLLRSEFLMFLKHTRFHIVTTSISSNSFFFFKEGGGNTVSLIAIKVNLTARNSFRRSSMLPLWMVKRAAAIWLMALARQWMLLQWPVGGSKCTP